MSKALPPWTYSSGEEPMAGDVICRVVAATHDNDCPSIRVGDVQTVTALTRPAYQHHKMPWVNSVGGYDVPVDPRQFVLIARPGQRVAYQPGDVVECIESGMYDGVRCGAGDVGERFTVREVGQGSIYVEGWNGGNIQDRFRLVHRPIKTVVHPPHARSAFGSNDLTITITGSQGSGKTRWAEFIKTAQVNRFQGAFIMPLPAHLPPATVVEGGSGCTTTETREVCDMDLSRTPKDIVERAFADTEKPANTPDPSWLQDVINVVEGRQERCAAPGKYRVYREGARVIFEDLRPIEAGCPVTSDRAPGKIGDVKGIDPDTHEAWVRWRNPLNRRDYSTINRADLRRAPAAPEKS